LTEKGFELKINIFSSNIYHSGLYSKITIVFSSHISLWSYPKNINQCVYWKNAETYQQESNQARTLPPGSPSPPKGAMVDSPDVRSASQTPHVIGARSRSTT
jgi:hypothetical protein